VSRVPVNLPAFRAGPYTSGLRIPSLTRAAATTRVADDPLRLLRLLVGILLIVATLVALLMAVTGVAPRAILLVGAFWALYGLFTGFIGGILEPVIDTVARTFTDVGLQRAGAGFSDVESLVARGHYDAAAEAYLDRAKDERTRVPATVRRAALLAGPLAAPELAASELTSVRDHAKLSPAEDLQIGLALVDILEYRLNDTGRAMAELRRLLDRYPHSRYTQKIRATLRSLKSSHFGSDLGPAGSPENPR